jgi:hypothetical protein
MRICKRYSTLGALFLLMVFCLPSQAMVVDSGFRTGNWLDSGLISLAAGSYSLDLTAFNLGPAGPTIFGISNFAEAFQVSLASFGSVSSPFTTIGGTFTYLVGGFAGAGTVFQASISPVAPVPLPSSLMMLGGALAAMVSIGRRGGMAGTARTTEA